MRRFALIALLGFNFSLVLPSDGVSQEDLESSSSEREAALPVPSQLPAASAADNDTGYLGLIADDEQGGGVRVISVRTGGPSHKAGIRPGDLIGAVQGQRISNLSDMERSLQGLPAGHRLQIEIKRGSQTESKDVVLARRQPGDASGWITGPAYLGVQVDTLNERFRSQRGIVPRRGAVVVAIEQGSPADKEGLPRGAVIVAMDGAQIESARDLIDAVRGAVPGQTVELSFYDGAELYRKSYRLAPMVSVRVAETRNRVSPLTTGEGATVRRTPPWEDAPRTSPGYEVFSPEPPPPPDDPDLILSNPTTDIELLKRTVDQLERHVRALQAQLDETNQLLLEIKRQLP